MLTLEKEFKFEAAHRLVKGYAGKCASIHGHSWVGLVEVTTAGDQMDEYDMLVDFADIKKAIAETVDALDHSCIVYENDPLVWYLVENDQKYYQVSGNPTSETLARHLFNVFTENLKQFGAQVISVTIKETCTSSCKITTNY